jgi:hypothetical protein
MISFHIIYPPHLASCIYYLSEEIFTTAGELHMCWQMYSYCLTDELD